MPAATVSLGMRETILDGGGEVAKGGELCDERNVREMDGG
jgi:hypothetical protein